MLVTKSSGMDRKGKKAGLPLFPFLGGGSSNEKEAVSNLISVRGGPTIEEDKIWKALCIVWQTLIRLCCESRNACMDMSKVFS